jgi:hypothetical protein
MRVLCPANLILFDLVTNCFWQRWQFMKVLRGFYFLSLHIVLKHNPCFCLIVRDQVSHPYKGTCKIIVFFKFCVCDMKP